MTQALRRFALVLLVAACSAAPSPLNSTPVSPNSTTTPTATSAQLPTTEPDLTITPAQTEGPFYPPDKPLDRDSDLTVVEGAPGPAGGEVLIIEGELLFENGDPVEGATVEIWQVDSQGIYLHPNSPNLEARDQNFQGYGEALADADGRWTFRTILPLSYEGRPRHIHVKVRLSGEEALTTQIYFEGDPLLAGDPFFAEGGEGAAELVIAPEGRTLANGEKVLHADHRIVLPF